MSCILSEYLIGTWLVDFDKLKFKESAMYISKSLWIKWKENEGFQLLFLILNLLAMTKTLQILALVSLRYFKAVWTVLENIFL